jgi:DNA-directed RNA polymerase subunit K/omega
MIPRTDVTMNAFELVALAGARARQLLRGCTPRADGPSKAARIAALEVQQGHVRRAEPDEE